MIYFRSSWERSVMRWLDENPAILKWNSEEVHLKYTCAIDGKPHKYYVDFFIEFANGDKVLVEVKPEYQTKKPKFKKNRQKFLEECAYWSRNVSKWKAAIKVAKENSVTFEVWTEKTLRNLGIRIIR